MANVAEVWALDLASYDSVKAFAKRALAELDRIDALIENAGVAMAERTVAEGHIVPVTVNVLSTLLLGLLLLPQRGERGRRFGIMPHLVVVTSTAGFSVQEDWHQIKDDPFVKMDDEKMVMRKTYGAYIWIQLKELTLAFLVQANKAFLDTPYLSSWRSWRFAISQP